MKEDREENVLREQTHCSHRTRDAAMHKQGRLSAWKPQGRSVLLRGLLWEPSTTSTTTTTIAG